MNQAMCRRVVPLLCVLLLATPACDSGGDDASEPARTADAKASAKSGTAQYCDVRSNEDSPNRGTCWEYPSGFPSPHICAGYRGTESTNPCPEADGYIGKCHFGAIDETTRQGDATSTVTREEFFVYQYDVADVGPKLAKGRKAECEGEKGVWIPG